MLLGTQLTKAEITSWFNNENSIVLEDYPLRMRNLEGLGGLRGAYSDILILFISNKSYAIRRRIVAMTCEYASKFNDGTIV